MTSEHTRQQLLAQFEAAIEAGNSEGAANVQRELRKVGVKVRFSMNTAGLSLKAVQREEEGQR